MEGNINQALNNLIFAYNDTEEMKCVEMDLRESLLELNQFESKLKSESNIQQKLNSQNKDEKSSEKISRNYFDRIQMPEFKECFNSDEEDKKLALQEKQDTQQQNTEITKDSYSQQENFQQKLLAELKRDAFEYVIDEKENESDDNKLILNNYKKAIKKNKNLFCELQVEKTEKQKLKKIIQQLEEDLKKSQKKKNVSQQDLKIKELKQKLVQKNEEIASANLNQDSLRKDIEKLNQILLKETGYENMKTLLENHQSGKWKGRTQKIQILKQKLKEFQGTKISIDTTQQSVETLLRQIKKQKIIDKQQTKTRRIEQTSRIKQH